jgi:peptidoglycan/xylan/chitin deacetylase (PgdA/CDA1 family)
MTTDLIARHAKSVVRRGLRQVANALDRPTLVLIYDRVTTLQTDPQQLAVGPEHFRAQLRRLKRHYRIDRFETPATDDGRRAVVITFDDGYADNCLEALPILEEEGVPATFFVSTGTIGTDREFCWDELERLLRVGDGHPPRIDLPLGEARFTAPTASDDERIAAYDALHPRVKTREPVGHHRRAHRHPHLPVTALAARAARGHRSLAPQARGLDRPAGHRVLVSVRRLPRHRRGLGPGLRRHRLLARGRELAGHAGPTRCRFRVAWYATGPRPSSPSGSTGSGSNEGPPRLGGGHGSRRAARGSRLAAHGSRLTARGSRLTAHGSRLTAHGRSRQHGARSQQTFGRTGRRGAAGPRRAQARALARARR